MKKKKDNDKLYPREKRMRFKYARGDFMKIVHLGHSGFLIEFHDCYCIFDYYVGNLPALDSTKPAVVFASHFHPDHYNPRIFELLHAQGMKQIFAVLSKDISEKRWPEGIPVTKVTFHKTYELPCDIVIQTLLSTDRGVAYLLRHDNCVIYHAGDLNDWSFDETSEFYDEKKNKQISGMYRHEIDLLKDWLGEQMIDAAFLPLDPRQGEFADRGMAYFLEKIGVKKAYPMHYWNKPEVIDWFVEKYPEYKEIVYSYLHNP